MTIEERIPGRPVRVGVLQAVRRYPLLALAPVILLGAVGAALGYARDPEYKSTAELAVGQLNTTDPAAVGTVVQATQTLASVYSRLIDASGLQEGVVRSVGPAAAGARILATPIPGSPLIRISVTAQSPEVAVRVANASSQALLKYAQRYSDTRGQLREISKRVRRASIQFSRFDDRVKRAKVAYASKPNAKNRGRLSEAQADLEGARLLRDSLRINYGTAQQNGRLTPVLRIFREARAASDDRRSTMELLGLIGLVAGLAVGAALATLRLNRRLARLTRP